MDGVGPNPNQILGYVATHNRLNYSQIFYDGTSIKCHGAYTERLIENDDYIPERYILRNRNDNSQWVFQYTITITPEINPLLKRADLWENHLHHIKRNPNSLAQRATQE